MEAGGAVTTSLAEDMLHELQQQRLGVDATSGQGEAPPPYIFKVPENIRAGGSPPFDPQILAIGPYHRCEPRLHAMERHKWRYLRHLLRRSSPGDDATAGALLRDCIEQVTESETAARRWYSEPSVDGMGSYDFVKMMVLDGCFILELLLKYHDCDPAAGAGEPLLDTAWMMPVICRDLLMLENQIPFCIIQKLFDVITRSGRPPPPIEGIRSLRELVRWFLQSENILPLGTTSNSRSAGRRPEETREIYHLLHFCDLALQQTPQTVVYDHNDADADSVPLQIAPCRRSRCSSLMYSAITSILKRSKAAAAAAAALTAPCDPCVRLPITCRKKNRRVRRPPKLPDRSEQRIPCAVKLREAGIKFKIKAAATTFLDVTFGGGTLEVPVLCIDDSTESLLRNLVAFENCRPNSDGHVTSYVLFLDCIIDTPRDVAVLEKSGVIQNNLGSGEEVAEMVNKLCKQVCLAPGGHYLAGVFREVNRHCESRCHRYRAALARDYFGSPWTIISFFAATALLLLTLLQLIYAVLSYHYRTS